MNIDTTTITKPSQLNETSATSSGMTTITTDDKSSFKAELEAVKSQDNVKDTEEMTNITDINAGKTPQEQSSGKSVNNLETKQDQPSFAQVQQEAQKNIDSKQGNSENNSDAVLMQMQQNANLNPQSSQIKASQENVKNNLTKSDNSVEGNHKNKDISDSLDELSSKIATINELKTSSSSKSYNANATKNDKISDKSDYSHRMKMDNSDITFFVNLVQNQGANAGANAAVNVANLATQKAADNSSDTAAQATSQSAQISQTLMNALNESMQTNKPFRIDFGSDVAVIMKVDKDGNISANFIPGSAAVENYLRNNISLLRQNFDNQNLPYNELSYSRQQKQDQQQQRNNKENKNE